MEEKSKTSLSSGKVSRSLMTSDYPSTLRRYSLHQSVASPGLSQSRRELIERYEYLADKYAASLNERDELRRQKRNLELEVASINKQKSRLQELLDSVKQEKSTKK